VAFRNVASYVIARKVAVQTSRGPVLADISYGGASYASVDASSVGLAVDAAHYPELIAIGREIKWALNDTPWARHPSDRRLDGIYGTILVDDLGENEDGPHQRNVTVFADGEVDRSPCGSGTSARIAVLAEDGRLAIGQTLTHDSIIGTTFLGRVVAYLQDDVQAQDRTGLITEIEGMAYQTGTATFSLDPEDPLGTGFLLR
jgi:proline racemase